MVNQSRKLARVLGIFLENIFAIFGIFKNIVAILKVFKNIVAILIVFKNIVAIFKKF